MFGREATGQWTLTENRFLNSREVEALRACARQRMVASGWGKRSKVLEWITLEIALNTGLRVSEIAKLCCGDIWMREGGGSFLVRNGKGGRRRVVRFGVELSISLREYMAWKEARREQTNETAPLILSSHTGGAVTVRALQMMFARVTKQAGVTGHRFHDLRHTYASYLYHASGNNLRMVQKQLGHQSIRTTEVYADVLDGETEKAVNALYR